MNRRRFILGTSAAAGALLSGLPPGADAIVPPAQALFLRGGGGVNGGAAPVQVATITYRNLAAAASPSPTPAFFPCWFTRGQVPGGQIVTPYVAGSPLATWQADNRVFWDDGSLMGARFAGLLPSIAASSTVQIVFKSSAGSWPNTSSVGLATVTSESDFKVALANLHTTQTLPANSGGTGTTSIQVGYTIAGGAVTGGLVQFNQLNLANGTYTLKEGNATVNASVTITGTSITVNSGGSGYAYEGTNGQFSAGFNAAVALFNANGNFNGVRIEQYAKGPVLDAWLAIMPLVDATSAAARPHTHAIFYVERWKTAGGALLNYRALGHLGNASLDDTNPWNNITFDLDWKSGATVVRGASLGSPGYTTIFVNQLSSVRTWDAGESNAFAAGRLDWFDPGGALSANDAALKAIVQERTAAEWAQLESTGLMQPYLTNFNGNAVGSALKDAAGDGPNGFSVSVPPSTQAAYNSSGTAGNELNYLPLCRPMALVNVRTGEGNGGAGHNEGIAADNIVLYGLALKGGFTTAAHSWLLVARGGACSFAGGANATPILDPVTFQIPNIVPAGDQTFGNMPDNHGVDANSGSFATALGYTNQILHQGSGGGPISASLSNYHLPRYSAQLYLVEGEEWMLRDMVWTAGNGLFDASAGNNGVTNRTISLGATLYSSLYCVLSSSREFAWLTATAAYATALSPTLWADGSTSNERAYLHYILDHNFSFLNTLVPFVGTVQTTGNNAAAKADWTGSGIFGMQQFISFAGQHDVSDTLFLYYVAMALPVAAFLCRDIPAIKTYLNYFVLSHASKWAFSGSHYMFDTAYFMELANDTLGGAPVTDWKTIDPAQAGWPQAGMSPYLASLGVDETAGGPALNFVGSGPADKIAVCQAGSGTGGSPAGTADQILYKWPGPVAAQNGSAVMLSPYFIVDSGGLEIDPNTGAPVAAPSGLSFGVWYYIGNQTVVSGAQTFDLYDTQAHALAGGATGKKSWTGNVYNCGFWFAPYDPAGLPSDTSGLGSYNGGSDTGGECRAANDYAPIALMNAYAFTASGDSVPYPALDAAMGISDAIGAALGNVTTFIQNINTTGVTFKDEPLYANAGSL